MEHPKDIGDRSTLAIMLARRGLGYVVSVPFGENARYDLVVDDGLGLQRVQSKTGRMRDGVVVFRTASSYAHHPHQRLRQRQRHYRGQVDSFAVYCAENGGVYLVPISQVPNAAACLRVRPVRNGQRRHVRSAAEYEIATLTLLTAARPRESVDIG